MAEARISVLWLVASVRSDEVLMASSWWVGSCEEGIMRRWGVEEGLRISVRVRMWCRPEETCCTATKVKMPVR